jgi:hypothetical protein
MSRFTDAAGTDVIGSGEVVRPGSEDAVGAVNAAAAAGPDGAVVAMRYIGRP